MAVVNSYMYFVDNRNSCKYDSQIHDLGEGELKTGPLLCIDVHKPLLPPQTCTCQTLQHVGVH